MLVLQTVVGALALGTGPAELDAFGNPLCIASTDHSGAGPKGSDHSKLTDCCAFGCSMFASAFAAPSEGTVEFRLPVVSVPLPGEYKTSFAPVRDHDPGNPRAPPLTA
ncbi:hypothetical protein [Mesorhizobium sp. KR1-2]|uniref:hypothetical protein n=1 Tax=Mesorhizobium sp. KR1-2 TaxID=3156609 RepID=UPI0032B5DEC4